MRDKDDNDITLKDYGDEEVDNDRKYSIDNLGAEVLDTDDFMYDDEEGVVADDDQESDKDDFFDGGDADFADEDDD